MPTDSTPNPKPRGPFGLGRDVHQYEFTGEGSIMRLFNQARTVNANGPVTSMRLNNIAASKIPSLLNLYDKARLYKELGFSYNASGSSLPENRRGKVLLYKPRRDSYGFLDGILSQEDRFNPILADTMMWVDSPFKRLRPSMWLIRQNQDGKLQGMHCLPDAMFVTTETRKEGASDTRLWMCTRWYVVPKAIPEDLEVTIELLRSKFSMPANITIDCLDNSVFDVHLGHMISGIQFDRQHQVNTSIGPTNDRPFFDQKVWHIDVQVNGGSGH